MKNDLPHSLVFKSATELAHLIRKGEVSSVQVVTAFLNHIEKYNSKIHAVVSVCAARALEEAATADKAIKERASLGALHGVPITIKDSYRVRGVRSTFGAVPQYWNCVPDSDCEQVRRLQEAGAIIIGRTNVPLLALDWQCRNPIFSEALNPWDTKRTPGGSSGGAAAAVAVGFSPLDLGSDLAGSIRYPAHCCGILGLRTSDGLLPIDDLGPEGMPAAYKHLVTCGPMARSIPDLWLMLEVLAKRKLDGNDSPMNAKSSKKLKIAWSNSLLGLQPDSETKEALNLLRSKLECAGHSISDSAGPQIDFSMAYRMHGIIAGHELKSVLPGFFKTLIGHWLFTGYLFRIKLGCGPLTKWISRGLRCSEIEYQHALQAKAHIWEETDRFFKTFDLWVLPVSPTKAIRRQRYGWPILLNGKRVSYSEFLGSYLAPTAMLGTPALTFPIESRSNMPISVQVHSKRFSDFELLQTAEDHFADHIQIKIPPGYAAKND